MRISLTLSGIAIITELVFGGYKSPSTPKVARFDHVIVVIEENHEYDELIGSANAPYINQLAQRGALFTDSHGVTHPSQPNYLILFSGSTQGVADDNCLNAITPYTTPNLGASLIKKGLTFKGYAHTMPSAGFLDCVYKQSTLTVGYLYARKHCPWVNWIGNKANNIPASCSLPMTRFPKDFSKLPTVSFVVPDMDYDMHNIGAPGDTAAIKRGDKWLKDNLASYVKWAKTHNSLLILTFDEDDYKTENQNHIPTIFCGAKINAGKYNVPLNHYNILHTLETMYNLPVDDAVDAAPITAIWKK
jgi:phosphatidylinositol-3-phosphatase